ncbi:CoB--CoM heterodisulfide reductase subunit B [Promethearchaeum syntrophicum]|uniref:CoB--CoM heterodisulfide reductase subunit B n=1 Tax=Promethearchaeum syntrophicum TaxID=2594042 RepID=A0A5B9DE18_9ARCH|nr:CoB--CoM heterodisulfide reductase subunit B [Candidatus Prometheoarchaeum syntrophicum]QEE16976.1 CoB--CoM heterodisulfide reductase subunit B [Candidatus Prometheoarchaeum syntrophicum]
MVKTKKSQKIKKKSIDSLENLIDLGVSFLENGDILEARHYFQDAIKKFPSKPQGFIHLGLFNLKNDDLVAASNNFLNAANLDRKNTEIWINLAKIHFKLGGLARAFDYSQKSLELSPNNPKVLFYAGIIKLFQMDLYYAKKYLTKAATIEKDPIYPYVKFFLGILYAKQGLYLKAAENFRAIKSHPIFKDISTKNGLCLQNNLGMVEYRLGNIIVAEQIFEHITKNGHNLNANIWINLAMIYWSQDKTQQNLSALRKASQIDPKSWPWVKELEEYLKSGQDGLKAKIQNLLKENPEGKNISMFLGCVIPNRYPFIDAACRHVLNSLKVGVVELEGAGCCPAPGVFRSFDINTWRVLGARNITIAEDIERDMCIMCNGCYGTLNDINTDLKEDIEKRDYVNDKLKEIGREFKGTIDTNHILWILYNDVGMKELKKKIVHKLDYNIAIHYGCHILKPIHNKPWKDSFEAPTFFDDIMELTGVKSIPHQDKLMCCGAGGGLRGSIKQVADDFTRDKMESYRAAGVDMVVDCCPFCHLQLDLGQVGINSDFKDKIEEPFKTPVIYFTQLLGLAMGLDPYSLGLLRTPQPKVIPPFIPVVPIFTKFIDDIDIK